jgi:hypothetical protein
VQAQYLTSDPGYLGCKASACQKRRASGTCKVRTCAATLAFHVINFRTDVEFVLFSGGFATPCVLKRSGALPFANPAKPLHGHLSSVDSKATSVSTSTIIQSFSTLLFCSFKWSNLLHFCMMNQMRLTWVSGDARPQQVQYGTGKTATSVATTFTHKDMCSE